MSQIIEFYSRALNVALEKHNRTMRELASKEERMKEIHRYSMEVEELTVRFERHRLMASAA